MTTLKAEKRDMQTKAKRLRREGFAPGVLFGKNRAESVPLKISAAEGLRFIKSQKEGSQVTLDIDGEKINALVKTIDYDSMKRQITSLDFQELTAGEKVSTTVPVYFLNESVLDGCLSQEMNEIPYTADPSELLEPITVDCSTLPKDIKNITVGDLKLTEGNSIELGVSPDTTVAHVGEVTANAETTDNGETAEAAEEPEEA